MTHRQATAADAPALTDFLARAFSDEREHAEATPLHKIEESFAAGDAWVVVEIDGLIVGCVCIELYSDQTGRISQLGVDAEHREKGLGTWLLAVAEKNIQSLRCTHVYLGVVDFKPEVLRFYRNRGYADSKLPPQAFAEPGKKPFKVIPLYKEFPTTG